MDDVAYGRRNSVGKENDGSRLANGEAEGSSPSAGDPLTVKPHPTILTLIGPSRPSGGPRTPSPPIPRARRLDSDDGFLGIVASWGEENRGKAVRTSRMIGSKIGLSPPPRPEPPREYFDDVGRFWVEGERPKELMKRRGSFDTSSFTAGLASIRETDWGAGQGGREVERGECISERGSETADIPAWRGTAGGGGSTAAGGGRAINAPHTSSDGDGGSTSVGPTYCKAIASTSTAWRTAASANASASRKAALNTPTDRTSAPPSTDFSTTSHSPEIRTRPPPCQDRLDDIPSGGLVYTPTHITH